MTQEKAYCMQHAEIEFMSIANIEFHSAKREKKFGVANRRVNFWFNYILICASNMNQKGNYFNNTTHTQICSG